MWLFAVFIALPLIEIGLFVTIGSWLTLWPTLAIVLASALLGASVIRRQGALTMVDLRQRLQSARDPMRPAAHGALGFLAGLLLIIPGFLTSGLGLLLLVPFVRHFVVGWAASHMRLSGVVMTQSSMRTTNDSGPFRDSDTIDGEFREIEPPKSPTHSPSGWTRH